MGKQNLKNLGKKNQEPTEQKDMGERCTNPSQKRRREEATTNEGTSGINKTRWPGWPGQTVFRLLVPTSKVRGIIGRRAIKKICDETRSHIQILNGGPAEHNCSERVVMVSAKEVPNDYISPAMYGILRVHNLIINEAQTVSNHPRDSDQIAEGCNPSQQAGRDRQLLITRMLLAGPLQASSIIGKGGETITDIRKSSNATSLRVLNPDEDIPRACALADDRVLEIRGEPANVHQALRSVLINLRNFLLDRSVLPLFESHIMSRLANQSTTSRQMEQQHHQQRQTWSRNDYNQTTNTSLPATGTSTSGQSSSQFGNQHSTDPPRHRVSYYDPPISAHELLPLETYDYSHQHYAREAPQGGQFSSLPANPPPAPPVTNNYQMQIPLTYADFVIGQNGQYIEYCRRISGATIIIKETLGVSREMTITIHGSASQAHTAQQLIINCISAARQQREHGHA